jgi:hypothetical protein
MRSPRQALPAALFCLVLAPLARSQDSHYWTNQYGTRATLLGGAVIGSVLDLSGTYYNPGGMSLIEKPETLLAANVFQYPRVTLTGNGQPGVPLYSQNPSPAPSIIAGTIRVSGLKKHWFGYSYLSRQDVEIGASISSTGVRDILPDIPGDEDFAAHFRLDEKVSERWFGLTWSYRVSENVGVGISQYLAVRSHRVNLQEGLETLDSTGQIAMASGSRQYQYRQYRTLSKIGLALDLKNITLGLTVTTPSLAIGGTASTGVNATVVSLDLDGDGRPDDYLAADYQGDQAAYYQTPFSLAGGMTVKIDNISVYWSAEWFDEIPFYAIVDSPPFAGQSTGEMLSTDVTQQLKSVFNVGVGLEWLYSSRFKGYASFTTDYSAKVPGSAANTSLTDWDIHHFFTGAEFSIKKTALTFGLGYSFGSKSIDDRPDIPDIDDIPGMWDPYEGMKFRYANYKLVLGIAI